jgi:membrane-associated phospholipid phosphatase
MFEMSYALQYVIKMIDYIGFFGPFLLLLITIALLKNKTTLLTLYIVGYILNIGLNVVLKGLIQEPRPSEDLRIFNAYIAQGRRFGFDRYGMPSGHAQGAFYSVGFILFALQDPIITIIYLIIALNTGYQRIKYKNHTLMQVICGSIIGAVMGYYFYLFSSKKIMGSLKHKKDDDAPI